MSAAWERARRRIPRLHASNGAPCQYRSLANQATSGFQGRTVEEAGSGLAHTSSSFTPWGTPSRAAPVNISEASSIRSRCAIGTALALGMPWRST